MSDGNWKRPSGARAGSDICYGPRRGRRSHAQDGGAVSSDPALRTANGQRIRHARTLALLPSENHARKHVAFDCPDCGWPTHCTEEHWKVDDEHHRYCGRLKEANEDEHDLRSGRRMQEFELPGESNILLIFILILSGYPRSYGI